MLAPLVSAARTVCGAAGLAAALAAGAVLAVATFPACPGMLIAYGRRIMTSMSRSKILYSGEGINSSIAISQWDDGAVQFHVSGKVEASTEPYDMRLQRMLGHMPALFHPQPEIGAGGGLRRGRHGGDVRRSSGSEAHRDLRDGAADSAHGHASISARRTTT